MNSLYLVYVKLAEKRRIIANKILLGYALSGALVFLSSCLADPATLDVAAVKRDFMALRMRAPFNANLQGLNDRQLFEFSCTNQRVKCDAVLELLKKEDPSFYAALKGEGEK